MLPASTTPAANLLPNFASVVDTGGKFASGVNDTGGKFAKIIKIFQFEDFCHLPPVSCEFSKKFETALLVYSGAWGKLIHEKKQKSEISWHCPFKGKASRFVLLCSSLIGCMPIYPLIRVEESKLPSFTSLIIATYSLKGTVSRDFLLQVFFVNHLLPGP